MNHEHIKKVVFVISAVPIAGMVFVWSTNPDVLGANPVEATTRAMGDWALKFLLLTLAITPLKQLTKWHALLKYRRMLGLFCFFYALVHLSSYVVLDRFFDWKILWKDVIKRPYIMFGLTAWLMLLALTVTSTNAMVRRMGWQNWQRLHYLIYPAVIFVLIHFWLMIRNDHTVPLIYGAIAVLLLSTRLHPVKWFNKLRQLMARP